MKNLIALFVISFFIAQSSFAQNFIGATGGLNLSTASTHSNEAASEVFAPAYSDHYFIGISSRFSLPGNFSLLADIQYSIKGFVQKKNGIDPFQSGFRNAYVDIIPQIEFSPIRQLGLALGCNVGIKTKEEILNRGKWEETKITELANDLDVGLVGSIRGYFGDFFASVSYQHGMTKVLEFEFTGSEGEKLGDLSTRNRTIQVGLGYYFGI